VGTIDVTPVMEVPLRYGIPVVGRPDRLVSRAALVERIRADPGPIVVLEAPPGSGKTTLLAEWALADPRPAAWLTIERAHSDPALLAQALLRVLAQIHPTGPLASSPRFLAGSDALRSLARLTRALDEERDPTLLILDDVHRLVDRGAIDLITTLADRFPATGRIALAARADPGLPIARWQLAGRVLVIGQGDLGFDAVECTHLLERLGVPDARELGPTVRQRTEGWVAGVHLMGLSYRQGPDQASSVRGDSAAALVESYLRSEILDRLDEASRTMLVRTSVVDVVTGPLADAVADASGSAQRLTEVADKGLLVTPVDASLGSFRYHSLLRDALSRELARDPATDLDVRIRASDWYETSGMPDEAIEQALGAGDFDRAAHLVLEVAQAKFRAGEVVALGRWIDAFDDAGLRERPGLAPLAAFLFALEGDPTGAAHWAAVMAALPADRPMLDPAGPGTPLVSAMLCAQGPESMLEDATRALVDHDELWRWRHSALFAAGMGALMLDEAALAAARFQEVELAHGISGAAIRFTARAERAMAEIAQHRWSAAQAILDLDRRAVLADPESGRIGALLWLVADARLAIHRGDQQATYDRLRRLQVGRVRLTWALPWHAVRTLTELARAQLLADDHQGARTTLSQARDTMAVRPRLGRLIDDLELVSQQALAAPQGSHSWSTLTRAELRLLPFLQTYLTIKEIGDRLGVSPNTAKTQALSIYGKLGASTRSEAIDAAVARGLLEDVLAGRS
jgi:LuxR family maltose regulon positive regulatory protein